MSKLLWIVAPWLFVIFWSGGYTFAKLGLPYIEPLTFLAVRYFFAIILLIPIYFVSNAQLPKTSQHWWALIITGFLIQAVYFGLAYLSMKQGIDVGTISLIFSMQPIMVAVLVPYFLNERVTRTVWVGLVLGLVGAAIVVLAKYNIEPESKVGILLALCALIGIIVGTLFEKRFGIKTHPVTNGIIQYGIGFAAILPLAILLESQQVVWASELVISLIYLVIFNSIISISLLIGMIHRSQLSKISSLFYLVPPLAIFQAWIILDEVMPPLSWFGFLFTVTGVYLVNRKK